MKYLAHWEKEIANKVKKTIRNVRDGHDFSHCQRTRDLALKIAKDYKKTDEDILIAICYLHDVGYAESPTGYGHCVAGAKMASKILREIGFPKNKINEVIHAVLHHEDYKFGKKEVKIPIETKILRDADLIDGFGAIGLSRYLMFAGANDIPLWRPGIKRIPKVILSNVSIIHNLDGIMKHGVTKCNTKLGRKIIVHRLKVMKKFVEEFKKEWQSKI